MPRQAPALTIEDTPTQARRYAEFLTDHNLNVVVATRGAEGLRVAESVTPDVILLDLRLPDMTGKQVLNRLRRIIKLAETPILILSAIEDQNAQQAILTAGASAFILKGDGAAGRVADYLRTWGLID